MEAMLKNIYSLISNEPHMYNTFKDHLGLTDDQMKKIFEWGSGPRLKVVKGMKNQGATIFGSNVIRINADYVTNLRKRSYESYYELEVFRLFMVVMHEATHYGNHLLRFPLSDAHLYGGSYEENLVKDLGFQFERKLMGIDPTLPIHSAEFYNTKSVANYSEKYMSGYKFFDALGVKQPREKNAGRGTEEEEREEMILGDFIPLDPSSG